MIAALARGAQVLDNPGYRQAASNAADFLLSRMRRPDGSLNHLYRNGGAGAQANIDDYSFLIWGLIELYQTDFKVSRLRDAVDLTDRMIRDFWDEEAGGFFFTPDHGEKLLARQKESFDSALPSGNSVAMLTLIRLSRLTGAVKYEAKAEELGRAFSRIAVQYPFLHTQMLAAVDFFLGPSYEVVLVGEPGEDDTRGLYRSLMDTYIPNKVVVLRAPGDPGGELTELAPYTEFYTVVNGKATVYVCENFSCDLPTNDPVTMLSSLGIR